MLSVVIPTFRKPHLLRRTLDALVVAFRELDEGEVVVVDDGSGDETPRVIEEYQSRLPIVSSSPAQNVGRARARNLGWRSARGRWVLFLDDDIVLEPAALRSHAAAQRERPAVYLGDVVTAGEVVDSTLFEYLDTRGVAKHRPGARVPSRYLLTQNVSIPRAALESIGGFDEDFGAYGFEDMELGFRLEDSAGMEFFRVAGARGEHIHHHTFEQYFEKKRLCGRESLRVLAQKHPARLREMNLDVTPGLGVELRGGRLWVSRALDVSRRLQLPRLVANAVSRCPGRLVRPLRHRALDYLVILAYADGARAGKLPE